MASSVTLSWPLSDARRLSTPHPNRNPKFNTLILFSLAGGGGRKGGGREVREERGIKRGKGGGEEEEDMRE